MGEHIRRFFYRPSITADSLKHIKSCEVSQKKDRTNPKQMTMQAREIVTIPSERMPIDLVGPFPVAKGGFRYLLTYLDIATWWPEAIPLKNTTTRIIIAQLTLVFSCNGFPTTIILDNGPQFVAKSFQNFSRRRASHMSGHPPTTLRVESMH